MTQKHSPNDQRSDVKNPNNPQYDADRQNRIDQGHGNAPTTTTPGTTNPQPPSPAPSRGPGGGASRPSR